MEPAEGIRRVAFVGNYVPRVCGIATFTRDLCETIAAAAPTAACSVVAMNDTPGGYAYPPRVRFQVDQHRLPEYQNAADFLNIATCDVVCVQHEFGIYGGEAGSYVLPLLRALRTPVVTTLHTVLRDGE